MAVAGDLETGALAAAFAAAPLEAWLSRLRAAGVPAAPVVLRHALLESEQVRANGLAVEFEHPVWGRTRAPGTLVHASRTPAGELGRAPVLSEHALEVLRELGYSLVEVREFVETGQVVIPELPDESHGEHNYRIARTALLLEEERSRLRYLYSQDVG